MIDAQLDEDPIEWQASAPLLDRADALRVFGLLQAQARSLGLSLRPPPEEPTSCCGRGCNGCVWEGFLAAAEYWRQEALLVVDVDELAC